MASPYWIEAALAGVLPMLWMSMGLGLPWALALLSVQQWQSRVLVAAVALAAGPAWMSAWMLILGVVGAETQMRLLTVEWIIGGSILIALSGGFLAWRKRAAYVPHRVTQPLASDEKLIVALIIVAVIVRVIHTAFWTFSAYDALWVFGYQGRLYFLEGFIPHSIDYYPQFLQLQFAYVQIVTGAINDHAARMVLPMLHIGSILAAYLLGERLISRRVGIFVAGLWSLHPFVGRWSVIGDLEIALSFSFTLAAVFFLSAWLEKENSAARRQAAVLAGLFLGIALFTKPTAGGFIWGVLLLFALELLRTGFAPQRWMPRFVVCFWTGLACLPLGGIWYLRNMLLGHEAVTWPGAYWLTQARRSGDYLTWLVLAVVVAILALALKRRPSAGRLAVGAIGIILMLGAVLASNPLVFPERFDPPASIIRIEEALALLAGLGLIVWNLHLPRLMRKAVPVPKPIATIAWSLLLALPYFVTFFFSYSYHYRLGFAVVPLLILPTAFGLSQIFVAARLRHWRPLWGRLYPVALIALGLPGIIAVAMDVHWSRVWLLDDKLDSDIRKYQVFNPSLLEVVFGLNDFQTESEIAPRVLAPGEQRLHFFFPQMQIIDRTVQGLDEFEALDVTHFIYGAKARQAYLDAGIDPQQAQLIAALGRRELFKLRKSHYDATFSYELYRVGDLSIRFQAPTIGYISNIHAEHLLFGDRLRLYAEDAYPRNLFEDTPITLRTVWQALQDIKSNYKFVLELFNLDSGTVERDWLFEPAPQRNGHYSTQLWDVEEVVRDSQVFRYAAGNELPEGSNYALRLGVIDPATGQSLPLTIDGREAGDRWQLEDLHRVGN